MGKCINLAEIRGKLINVCGNRGEFSTCIIGLGEWTHYSISSVTPLYTTVINLVIRAGHFVICRPLLCVLDPRAAMSHQTDPEL